MRRTRIAHATAAACLPLLLAPPAGATVDVAQLPLFTVTSVPPNIVFVIDDSGSMTSTAITINGGSSVPGRRSVQLNALYYSPGRTYRPWLNADGSRWPNATLTSTTSPAREYYHYNGGPMSSTASYTRVQIVPATATYTGHGRQNRTDCARAGANPPSCTYAEELQNFANWWRYHGSRTNAAKAGIGEAFAQLDGAVRLGWGRINKAAASIDGGPSLRALERGVRPFEDTVRTDFYTWLHAAPASGYTPLRAALQAVGNYYSRADDKGPWSTTPGTGGGEMTECRRSYTILMSDGGWNDGDSEVTGNLGNEDGAGATSHTGPGGLSGGYTPADPFRDNYSKTLADVAMAYWKNDLVPSLANLVPTSARDPAFWQHMTTYTVGFGLAGTISPAAAEAAVLSASPIAWPNPIGSWSEPVLVDDMLHAGINARGGYFSATDPEAFATQLDGLLAGIVQEAQSSAASAATSTAVLQDTTLLYTAGFRNDDWTGFLTARAAEDDGSAGQVEWDAEATLAEVDPDDRQLLTRNSETGDLVELDYDALSEAQQGALDRGADNVVDDRGEDRIAWLRGTEGLAGMRSRSEADPHRLLGDIINSNPQHAGKTNFGYGLLPGTEGRAYAAFRAADEYAERADALYVAANDGMLHAFDAASGAELFAYVPSELLLPEPGRGHAPLSRLMAPAYEHRYFMDGTPVVRDAYLDGAWRTVLVGSMGAGGRTVFALDVTDPTAPLLLWEFTHEDLGVKVGQPAIVRLRDGTWAALFGNGVNGATGSAAVFVVDLADGTLIQQLDTGVGDTGEPNGILGLAVTDFPYSDLQASRIYAGDLQGNLWRFDVSSQDPEDWLAEGNSWVLFGAEDAAGDAQPITVRPALALLPGKRQTLVVAFGTGSYFRSEDGDTADAQTQSFYAIFDDGLPVGGRDDLLEQTIDSQASTTFGEGDDAVSISLRTVSEHELDLEAHRGWFLDLAYDGENAAERVISPAVFPTGSGANRIRFATLIPTNSACGGSRDGYLMDLDLFSGARTSLPLFDLTDDGNFDDNDLVNGAVVSGIDFGTGEAPATLRLGLGGITEVLFTGRGERVTGRGGRTQEGRQSWRQVR